MYPCFITSIYCHKFWLTRQLQLPQARFFFSLAAVAVAAAVVVVVAAVVVADVAAV